MTDEHFEYEAEHPDYPRWVRKGRKSRRMKYIILFIVIFLCIFLYFVVATIYDNEECSRQAIEEYGLNRVKCWTEGFTERVCVCVEEGEYDKVRFG